MRRYKDFFCKLQYCAFATSIFNFVIFFLTFLLLCFAFTTLKIPEDGNTSKEGFILKFQRYFVLTAALMLLIPFLLSLILTFGILHRHILLLNLWLQITFVFFLVYTIGLFTIGIYLTIEGALYVGCSSFVIALLLGSIVCDSFLFNCGIFKTRLRRIIKKEGE